MVVVKVDGAVVLVDEAVVVVGKAVLVVKKMVSMKIADIVASGVPVFHIGNKSEQVW